ncbi:MAG: hypothetical protein WC827_03435 [Candidatus Paceibacterota bacterium]|jgi:hypothetical protein
MKNDTAQVRMATPEQMREIYTTLMQGVPAISFEVATYALAHKREMITHVLKFFPNMDELTNPIKQWENFYFKVFGFNVDFSGIKIPERTEAEKIEFTRLIIVLKGLSLNNVYGAFQMHFKCWRYTDDLNQAITKHEAHGVNSYAMWVRDTVEADEVHKNKSAEMVKEENLKTETVLERMIHELKYFWESGKHLDINNVTLCSGSRDFDGFVPGICWSDGGFKVDWYRIADRSDRLRSREVIS